MNVPLPERMKSLLVDKRGYPIPYIVMFDPAGMPLFTVNDQEKQRKCVKQKLCPICGQRLTKELWFVGGPRSAFHKYGCYMDSAMHHECMTYALQVCPYLALRNYRSTAEVRMPDYEKRLAGRVVLDPTIEPDRPTAFVAVMSTGQSVDMKSTWYIRPLRPYLGVEFWNNGVRLSDVDGIKAVANTPDVSADDVHSCLRLLLA